VKDAENDPTLEAVTVAGVVWICDKPNVIVIVDDGTKFDPDAVTVVPIGPLVGDNDINGAVTVKRALAESLLSSIALTMWPPEAEVGTLNATPSGIEPDGVVVVFATILPSNSIAMLEDAAKLEPDTVTIVPTGPAVGDNVIEGATVKVAEAELPLESVALTMCPPMEEGGTAKAVLMNEPTVFELTAGDVVCCAPSYVIVIFELAAKPCPETVTIVPTGPLVGKIMIDGITVNVAEAWFELASIAFTV
jgi:hypothetical protein